MLFLYLKAEARRRANCSCSGVMDFCCTSIVASLEDGAEVVWVAGVYFRQ